MERNDSSKEHRKGWERMEKSKNFYVRLKGSYALFTNGSTKGGGEKFSYSVPTRQALNGIVDAIYYKPTFRNIVTEVKVIRPVQTEVIGTRALIGGNKADLNYVSYLTDVEYLVKYHFEWNEGRSDLIIDRNRKKHEAIMDRSLDRGGRRDIFLGTRECVGLVEKITEEEYLNTTSFYDDQILSFGIMFHSFNYGESKDEALKSYYTETIMKDGVIQFKPQIECEIVNTLTTYKFKETTEIKSVDKELDEYQQMEER